MYPHLSPNYSPITIKHTEHLLNGQKDAQPFITCPPRNHLFSHSNISSAPTLLLSASSNQELTLGLLDHLYTALLAVIAHQLTPNRCSIPSVTPTFTERNLLLVDHSSSADLSHYQQLHYSELLGCHDERHSPTSGCSFLISSLSVITTPTMSPA